MWNYLNLAINSKDVNRRIEAVVASSNSTAIWLPIRLAREHKPRHCGKVQGGLQIFVLKRIPELMDLEQLPSQQMEVLSSDADCPRNSRKFAQIIHWVLDPTIPENETHFISHVITVVQIDNDVV